MTADHKHLLASLVAEQIRLTEDVDRAYAEFRAPIDEALALLGSSEDCNPDMVFDLVVKSSKMFIAESYESLARIQYIAKKLRGDLEKIKQQLKNP